MGIWRSWGWKLGAADMSRVAQGTAAATIAWLLANLLPNGHGAINGPIFAPIAAFVALNAPLGERGRNALRLLRGVLVGIVAGELAVAVLPGGYGLRIAAATLVATAIATGLGGPAIVIAQAASGAIVTVVVAQGHPGVWRLADALVGAGVALVFSQVLFSPEPVKLVRRAEAASLLDMAAGLGLLADGLERDDGDVADQALDRLRDMRDRLTELGRVRRAGRRMARRSAVWRRQEGPAVRESENAAHIDLLASSCVMLARTAVLAEAAGRRWLAPCVRDLGETLSDLAREPGSHDVRQGAADAALTVVRRLADQDKPGDAALDEAIAITRTVAADVMVFAGADAGEAAAATRAGTGELEVSPPPSTARIPLPRRTARAGRRRSFVTRLRTLVSRILRAR
jgi:hypothetical protein